MWREDLHRERRLVVDAMRGVDLAHRTAAEHFAELELIDLLLREATDAALPRLARGARGRIRLGQLRFALCELDQRLVVRVEHLEARLARGAAGNDRADGDALEQEDRDHLDRDRRAGEHGLDETA